MIDVDLEALEPLTDPVLAADPDAPRIHPQDPEPGFACPDPERLRPGNAFYEYAIDFVRDGEAATHPDVVVERDYQFPAVYQYAMEPHGVVAQWQPDRIVVHSSCQHPFMVRQELAVVFGVATEQVEVIVPFIGGGFGSKSYTKMEPVAVAVSRVVGRRVRLLNRVEDAMVTTRRHGMVCHMRTTAAADGTLLSRTARLYLDTGAYADNGPTVTMVAALGAVGAYRWAQVDVAADCVYTNLPPAGSYRGFGATHLMWISESQIDEIAGRLGQDRVELRRRNLLHRGEDYVPGHRRVDADLPGDFEAIVQALGPKRSSADTSGIGFAVGISPGGASPLSTAKVELELDGALTVKVGSQEIGQGARTVHAQIAADVLALPIDRVIVPPTNTSDTPFDRSTGASRSTTVAGLAVQRAAEDLREKVLAAAAKRVDVPVELLSLVDGHVVTPQDVWPLSEFAPLAGEGDANELRGGDDGPEIFWEVSLAGVELSADRETGAISIERIVTGADAGRAINPALVERQDEGCAIQALGNVLFEEMEFDESGVLLNGSLTDYRVPRTPDVPASMQCVIIENHDGPGPYGAKGIGEGTFAGVVAATVCALGDAGARVTELPLTAPRVWRAFREAQNT